MTDAPLNFDAIRKAVHAGYQRGWRFTPLDGKKPRLKRWNSAEAASLDEVYGWIDEGHNIGLRCGDISGVAVLDIDRAKTTKTPADFPLGPTVITGSDGWHVYYAIIPGQKITNSAKVFGFPKGIDVRGEGGQVVFPGSIHPETQKLYRWAPNMSPDDVDLASWPFKAAPKLPKPPPPVADNAERRCMAYLKTIPPAIAGQGGHDATFRAACECVRFDLDQSAAWRCLQWFNANKCDPPWTEDELRHKLDQAFKEAASQTGQRIAEQPPQVKLPPPPPAMKRGPAEAAAAGSPFMMTDLGNAERLVARYGDDLRWDGSRGIWLAWDRMRWVEDALGKIERHAKATVRGIYEEASAAAGAGQTEKAEHLAKHAKKSESAAAIAAMLRLARTELNIGVLAGQLDADPWLLNTPSGTVEMKTGTLREHRRADLITKITLAPYVPVATRPIFDAFMARIFQQHPSLIEYLQRAIGYAATGSVEEHTVFVLYGSGANGKSTLMQAVSYALGDYAGRASPDLLLSRDNVGHPTGMADLLGRRLVTCSEWNEGARIDEGRLKDLIGEQRVKARRMRQDFFEFAATHSLFVFTNHKPTVRGSDHGLWRRIHLVPFVEQISMAERDTSLPAKLEIEAAGILGWIVEGTRRWLSDGIGLPDEVARATNEYRAEMDVLGGFLSDCCIRRPELSESASGLYAAYQSWGKSNGERIVNQTQFGLSLNTRGYPAERSGNTGWKTRRFGLALRWNVEKTESK